MTIFCIYHANCQDGFTAAWAVRHALGEDAVEFFPGVYQNPPPDCSWKDVVLVDFSYKRPVLEELAKTARSVCVLDHHQSAAEDLAGLPEPLDWGTGDEWYTLCALFDLERSGAGIAWDYFHPGEPRPRVLNHVEDRDLWRFKLPQTRAVAAALFSHEYDFNSWDRLMLGGPETLFTEGIAIERKHHKDVAELVKVTRRSMTIGGIEMPVANLPHTLTSDAGNLMAMEDLGVAACYWDTPEGRVFSLRSADHGPNVAKIAEDYGGGGHPHAAGFRVAIGWEGEGSSVDTEELSR